jgi:hypothetical protein
MRGDVTFAPTARTEGRIKTALIWTMVIVLLPALWVISFIVQNVGWNDDDGKPLPVRHW